MLIVQDFSEKLRDQYLLWKLHVHCESHTPLCYYLVSAYFPSGHYTVEATPSSTSIIEMIPGSYIASFPGPRPASRHLQYGSFWSLHWGSFTLASFPGLPWLQFLIACSMQKRSQLSFTLHPTWAHKNGQVATLATGSYALLTSTRGCTTTNTMEVIPSSYSFHNVKSEGR